MWTQVILAALSAAPDIIKAVESLFPGRGQSGEKLAAAETALKKHEPLAVETDALRDARAAKISADVAYANALSAASSSHGA